ncbi:MAG: amidohydrolase family protein [Promethearchaeota archaeon]
MIDNIKIFDSHMHYLGRFKKRDESIIEFMDRFHIDKAVITTLNQAANLNTILKSNKNLNENEFIQKFIPKTQYNHEKVKEIIQKNSERLIGFFWFNPRIATEDDWHLLEKYIVDYKFKGVKTQCYVDLLKIPSDIFQLAEFCIEYNIPLFVHSGSAFFFQRPVRVKDYYKLAKKYKELKLIIGHAAFTMEYCINCLRFFAKNESLSNVFFETSVSIPYGIMTLIKALGSQRVIFGSDSPTATTPDLEINKILILNFDKETLENVFYNNISSLVER